MAFNISLQQIAHKILPEMHIERAVEFSPASLSMPARAIRPQKKRPGCPERFLVMA
jgi:hypothetical protein